MSFKKLVIYIGVFLIGFCVTVCSLILYFEHTSENEVNNPIKVKENLNVSPAKRKSTNNDNAIVGNSDTRSNVHEDNKPTKEKEQVSNNDSIVEDEEPIKSVEVSPSNSDNSEQITDNDTQNTVFTREQAIEHLAFITGMSRDQIENGNFYFGSGDKLDIDKLNKEILDNIGIRIPSGGIYTTATSKSDAKRIISEMESKGDQSNSAMTDFLKSIDFDDNTRVKVSIAD